jgi:hypothetical protein
MATTSNTYTGNGSNKLFSITFPYLDTSDIDVYLNGMLQTITTQYTFANATTVEFVAAPANGAVILLDRSSDDTTLQATFFPGSSIKAADLNDNFDQVLFLAQETNNNVANAVAGQIPDGTITNAKLAADSVASSNIIDGTIVNADVNSAAGILASKLSFTQSGSGATARTIDSKLKDAVSVKDFGAVGDGVADDTAAFSAAAQGVSAAVNIVGAEGALPRAPMCSVFVPAGTYLLTSEVNTNNREVVWIVDQAARITGYSFINGKIFRPGQRQNVFHHGTTDYACTQSIRSNKDLEDGAEVVGITSASQLASYGSRDSVSLYVDNTAPAATVDVNTATYTSTTVTIAAPSATVLRRYRRGMIIDTKHSPKWSGIIDSWNNDGSVLTVTAWYQFGAGGTPGTPANGTGCVVNGFTKIWAHNANCALKADSFAADMAGFELGMINDKSPADKMRGFDCVNLGTHKGTLGFVARGAWEYGFYSDSPDIGFFYIGAGSPFAAQDASQNITFAIIGSGSIELGNTAIAGTRYIDFHSSGFNSDYDARILALGGSSTNGQGALTLAASSINCTAAIRPSVDTGSALGGPSNRWTEVFAATGTINTSDEREKQDISLLDAAEKRVAVAIKGLVKKFRFKSAVQARGENARIHVGVIAQEVVAAFTAEGLDAARYGILCYDEWDELEEIKDEKGNIAQVYCPAGNRYGIRYEELLAFIIAAI